MTYKSTLPVPCSEVWSAVKDTLGNPENYSVVASDDTKMAASCHVKHAIHASISGAVLQRVNKVTSDFDSTPRVRVRETIGKTTRLRPYLYCKMLIRKMLLSHDRQGVV